MPDEVTLDDVRRLAGDLRMARPSDRRLGAAIAAYATIDLEQSEGCVVATVDGSNITRRTVTFARRDRAVVWRCTCTSRPSPWCKHVVASIRSVLYAL
jgi:uncharacterized Zn finger protein